MERGEYRFIVTSGDQEMASRAAAALADVLREVIGVEEVYRQKADSDTMDLGTIVGAIAASGATLALAQGVASWLRSQNKSSLTIEVKKSTESVKAKVVGIDADAAARIVEIVRG